MLHYVLYICCFADEKGHIQNSIRDWTQNGTLLSEVIWDKCLEVQPTLVTDGVRQNKYPGTVAAS